MEKNIGSFAFIYLFFNSKVVILGIFFKAGILCVYPSKYVSINNIRTRTLFGIKLKPFALCMLISFFTTQFPYDAI